MKSLLSILCSTNVLGRFSSIANINEVWTSPMSTIDIQCDLYDRSYKPAIRAYIIYQ